MNDSRNKKVPAMKEVAIEVAYATAQRQCVIPLTVGEGMTAYEAVLESGILDQFDAINPDRDPMGVYGQLLDGMSRPSPKEYLVQQGDRIEIYRPLIIDPKQARLDRAARKQTPQKQQSR